ncbi:MAG: metal transporter [Desulfobacterales bacterium]|nr:metal transporter [Desulfobacterales bacterium]
MTAYNQSDLCEYATAAAGMFNAIQTSAAALTRYSSAYSIPLTLATSYFNQIESRRFWFRTPAENFMTYLQLGAMNLDLAGRAIKGDLLAIDHFMTTEVQSHLPALASGDSQSLVRFAKRIQSMIQNVAYTYPAAIENIADEFGFHFERQPASSRIDETDRFILYQVLPSDPKVEVRSNGKPILIIPPFVLGANILAFLPHENRSYAHAFANQGIPTYIRVLKDIRTSEAIQCMRPEDDTQDTRQFCEIIKARHGLPLTLNGYCQGGYAALGNLLSGELDGLVDAFITCVTPMDGTRSQGLCNFLKALPPAFNDLAYGTKLLPNGHKVADGNLMGWIYKLKSIETETPLLAMWRDMMLVARSNGDTEAISKTAAALNYWLTHDRYDLPLEITRMSFEAYNTPISKHGNLPLKLFGRRLNLKRLQEKKIPWLICYGKQDDLVEPETALAPLDHVDAEVSGFPKGHVAIATSWSHPASAYALHLRYPDENTRGPVRFQLDLQEAIDQPQATKPAKTRRKPQKKAAGSKAVAKGSSPKGSSTPRKNSRVSKSKKAPSTKK